MEDLIWNDVPKQRQRKVERFDTPVVSLNAIEKVGAGRKFIFNKAAQELLGIKGKDRVSFGFTKDGQHIFLRKSNSDAGYELTQVCTISDKKTYEFIAKQCNLNIREENHFDVVAVEGASHFEMVYRPMVGDMEVVEFLAKDAVEITADNFGVRDLGTIVDETMDVEDSMMEEVLAEKIAEEQVLDAIADEVLAEEVEEEVTIDDIIEDEFTDFEEEEVEEEDEW
jgi:bifunctional DNA-binding transcriptional regulator/antitoxin component of YhaV-PrlF toxin-antitoxin module